MKKREGVVNINFFKKVWYSITNFEQYPAMATEGFGRAIKYLIGLTAIISIFLVIGSLLQIKIVVEDFSQYVQNEIPEFSYENGNLNMQMEDTILIEDIADLEIGRVVINTLAESDEQKTQIENENSVIGTNIFLFKDEIILEANTESEGAIRQTFTYTDFIASYTGQYIESFDKAEFVQFLTSENMKTFYISYGIAAFISTLLVNIIVIVFYALEIAVLGLITATIARIKIRFVAIYNMAAYSLTLSIILNIIYIVINYFVDFTITYFQVAYITIAYIYLAATIFILKDDLITKMQEVEKIKQEQLKVHEEIKKEEKENKKEEKEDKKDEKKKKDEDEKGENPQGSEA